MKKLSISDQNRRGRPHKDEKVIIDMRPSYHMLMAKHGAQKLLEALQKHHPEQVRHGS